MDGTNKIGDFNGTMTVQDTAPVEVSLFPPTSVPANTKENDNKPLDVGVKFASSAAGKISAIQFYRSPGDTGPNMVTLWSAGGTKLANVQFTNTSVSGWQTVKLPTPVTINANTTYVVSYHSRGAYVSTVGYFSKPTTNGPLTAPASGNGVYTYGGTDTSPVFPTSNWQGCNYWADVVFTPG
jgi:hypothetical protein